MISEFECSICLTTEKCEFGVFVQHTLKCGHTFHIGCIQRHFLIKHYTKEEEQGEFVLECPLCRAKTYRNNWGVKTSFSKKNMQMTLQKSDRQITFNVDSWGKDIFNKDYNIAKQMLQKVANLCLDVDSYWLVADILPQFTRIMDEQYIDKHNQCVKRIVLPQEQRGVGKNDLYIERSYGL